MLGSGMINASVKSCYGNRPGGWGAGGGGAEAPNNCQTVVCFLYNSVLNEKEYNGQPPQYEFRSDGTGLIE